MNHSPSRSRRQEDTLSVARFVIDILIVAAVGLTVLFLSLFGEPYRRGFFCDDDSIRYPHKESTVPAALVGVSAIGLPVVVVTVSELLESKQNVERRRSKMFLHWPVPLWIQRWCRAVSVFLFGAGVSEILVKTAKYTLGHLRPHFISVCIPDVDCNSPDISLNDYIDKYECTGTDLELIRDARMSFPSGHSSLSFYAATFTVMYLENMTTWRSSSLFRHTIQAAFVVLAWITALSRVADFMHHWSDVLAGMIIGTASAFFSATTATDLVTSWCCLWCTQAEKCGFVASECGYGDPETCDTGDDGHAQTRQ